MSKLSKARANFKGALFLFIILIVVAATVLAIIFWPQKAEEIKISINDQAQTVLSRDGEFFKSYETYGEYAKNYHSSNATASQAYETVENVFKGLEEYFYFISYALEYADFSKYERGDIKNTQTYLSRAENSLKEISTFINDKNQTITKDGYNTREYENADAELVWKNITNDLKDTFSHYYGATAAIAKVYRRNVNKGVYSNDFAFNVVDGVSYYMNYFVSNHDRFSSEQYHEMSEFFVKYVNSYLSESTGQRLVGQSLISKNLQDCSKTLNEFDGNHGDLTRESLVVRGLTTVGLSFTTAQFANIEKVVEFYKGGLTK